MTLLSVNLNKIAVLRNSRGGTEPNICTAARVCMEAGCGGCHHGAAQQHGILGGRLDHRAAGGIGLELHEQRVLQVAAGDVQGVDAVAAFSALLHCPTSTTSSHGTAAV